MSGEKHTKYKKPILKKRNLSLMYLNLSQRKALMGDSIDYLVWEGRLLASGCFHKSTKVLMEDGEEMPIYKITSGMKVVSYDLKRRKPVVNTVKEVIMHDYNESKLVKINNKLIITPNHRIWINNSNWHLVETLTIKDKLFGIDGLIQVEKLEILHKIEKKVYNLSLEHSPYNFFAEGILVHNGNYVYVDKL